MHLNVTHAQVTKKAKHGIDLRLDTETFVILQPCYEYYFYRKKTENTE